MNDITRYKSLTNGSRSESKVNVLISNFGLQTQVPVDDIANAVSKLPPEHLTKLEVIKYDPDRRVSFILRHQRVGPQLAEYLGSFNSIVVYRFSNRKECFHVLYHEIGHHVYFKSIDSYQKKEWVTQVYPTAPGVTAVGQKNACEDFAECYALYLTEPNTLKRFKEKFQFIDQLFH